MAKQSPTQKRIVERVMHEFKHGELEQRDGEPVENPKQAIAIALHEAGASEQEDPKTNKRNLSRTKRKEAAGRIARDRKEGAAPAIRTETRSDLYKQAKQKNVPGRSRMSKAELARAVHA